MKMKDLKASRPVPALNRKKKINRKKVKTAIKLTLATGVAAFFAILFLTPIILTITNSFMSSSEISANYGSVFATTQSGGKVFISEKVNLKFIPDIVSFSQYITVLFKSPDYLFKFWNSVILVGPIVLFQLATALLAAYGFTRYRGRIREIIFFAYIILMLMPYQVTLVPNYLVSNWLHILDTRWAIWLPGIFSPFAVYLLTKYMRKIPYSVIEAAKIDGANKLQRILNVDLPAIMPTMVILLIMNCGSILSVGYEKVYLLQNDLNTPVSKVISTYIYKMGLQQQRFSYSTAIGLFNNVVNFIILITVNRVSKKISGMGLF